MLSVRRIESILPDGFDALRIAAQDECVRNMEKLAADWQAGGRWESGGAALFGAFAGPRLAGVGGVIAETAVSQPAMRVHRFYVLPEMRRLGAGRALAVAAVDHALRTAPFITCNAQASLAARPFWEAMGFAPVSAPGYTHVFRAGMIAPV
jgi:GNAT superfamily N-acetyltransferase